MFMVNLNLLNRFVQQPLLPKTFTKMFIILIIVVEGLFVEFSFGLVFGQETVRKESKTGCDSQTTRNLVIGNKFSCTLTPEENHSYDIKLEENSFLHIVGEQKGTNIELQLFDSSNQPLTKVNYRDDLNGLENLYWKSEKTGTYRLEIHLGENEKRSGEYLVYIKTLEPFDETKHNGFIAAQSFFEEAQGAFKKAEEKKDVAELKKSNEIYKKALDDWKKSGDMYGQIFTLSQIGVNYYYLGDLDSGISSFKSALEIISAYKDESLEAKLFNNLGATYQQAERLEEAMNCFSRASHLRELLSDNNSDNIAIAFTLNNIGRVHQAYGEYEQAIKYHKQALDIRRKYGTNNEIAQSLNNLAITYVDLKDYEQAAPLFEEALNLVTDKTRKISILANLGSWYLYRNLTTEADNYYKQAIIVSEELSPEVVRKIKAGILNNQGSVYKDLGNYDEALKLYKQALPLRREASDPRGEAITLNNMGQIYEARGYEQVAMEDYYKNALKAQESKDGNDPEAKATTLYCMARVERKRGNFKEALDRIDAAIKTIENLLLKIPASQRATFFDVKQQYYDFYIDLLMQLHKIDPTSEYNIKALEISEQARQKSLFDISLGSEFKGENPLTIKDIKLLIADSRTLLIEFWIGAEHSYVWAVTQNSVESYELPRTEILEKTINAVYDKLVEPRTVTEDLKKNLINREQAINKISTINKEFIELGKNLGQILLKNIVIPSSVSRLIIISRKELQFIPFSALPIASKESTENSSYTPLIVKYEIITLPSLSLLASIRSNSVNEKNISKTLIVFADPVFSEKDERYEKYCLTKDPLNQQSLASHGSQEPNNYERLPFSCEEAEEIIGYAEKGKNLIGFDANFNSSVIKSLSEYKFIHFATHTKINYKRPLESSLVLSLKGKECRDQLDGFLTAGQISELKLNASLVVLSACDSLLGKKQLSIRPTEISGLTQAFLKAGASRVMASFWTVNDVATKELMVLFYKFMKEGKNPSSALQAAQIKMYENRYPPYYWAGFTLCGEW